MTPLHPAIPRANRLKVWILVTLLEIFPSSLKLTFSRWLFRRRCPQPRTFFERLHWHLIERRDERLIRTSDKVKVRDYVASKVGSKYLSKIYGVYYQASQIPFRSLPEKFVLKANHGSGWNLLVRHKSRMSEGDIRARCGAWLGQVYSRYPEWWYREITPALLVEEFLEDAAGEVPADYKFFVFRGEVGLIQVDTARFTDHRRNLYGPDWTPLEASLLYPRGAEIPRPAVFDEMTRVAEKLGEDFDFVRIDLYALGHRVVFGEMTYLPESGSAEFSSRELDEQMTRCLERAFARR